MKRFNKVSKITTIFIFLLGGLFTSATAQTLNPPENLDYTVSNLNDVTLFWNAPQTGDTASLHWDNGINYTSWGFLLNGEQYSCASKWNPEHISNYDGWKIKKIRIYLANTTQATTQIKIWSGPEATEIYSQDVPGYTINQWNEFTLDEPVVIDASTQLWAGMYFDCPSPAAIIGLDEGPAVNGYGNLYHWNGSWHTQGAGNWNIQLVLEKPSEPTYLHWDSGTNDNFFGFFLSGSYQFSCAAKWNPEHITEYDGWNITSMRFFLSNSNITEVKLKLWTGPNGTEVYSQDINDYNINDWTEVTLDTPFPIDASTNLWGGIYIDMPSPGAPVGLDEGPVVPGQGFWLHYQGQWWNASQAGINDNMNVQLGITPPDKDTKEGSRSLLGYKVYRNDELQTPDPITPTVFLDENLYNGTYNYYVTAVYDEGESDPSNTVVVVIDVPTVLEQDSLALVDLYNSCDGPNWTQNDEWLEGPITEWHGVTVSNTRVTKLWLQMNNLSGNLPASIGDLTGLQEFHVEMNNITSMPTTIGNMTALKEFWIGWNPITVVPESIGNLSNLEQLHLGFTNLGTLPESFGNLSSLTWLALGDAGLNSLPNSFGNLTAVDHCFLWGNNLTELPESFGNLASMKYLSLEDNQLTHLPDNFGNMSNLLLLRTEYNFIEALPESFGNLESLKTFYANNNQLMTLPESFGNLGSLSQLIINNNMLMEIPESFGNLSELDTCLMYTNALATLPESIGNLDDLKLFNVAYNGLTSLPESIGDMESLIALSLDVNQLQTIPESFANLQSLKSASLAVNQINAIPENIGEMTGLISLNLSQNSISEVPESMGNMSSLTALGLASNNISSLPESFGNLNLDILALNFNNLDHLPDGLYNNNYNYLYIQENAFQFGDIEPMMSHVNNFVYAPQAMIGVDTTLFVEINYDLSYTIEVSGENNVYQWYLDGVLLPDQTSNTLYLEEASWEDIGNYVLKVTNTMVPELELISHNVYVDLTTGINEATGSAPKIYPNPVTTGTIIISLDDPESVNSIAVYNTTGQLMLNKTNISAQMRMDVSRLVQGMYIVKVNYQNGMQAIQKLVVR